MTLTDRQRVELAIPARLMFDVLASAIEDGSDLQANDIRRHLVAACAEPLEGLAGAARSKIIRRIERVTTEAGAPYYEKVTAAKMAMTVFYFVEALIDQGILELYADTPMAHVVQAFMALLGESFAQPTLDESAKKQGVEVLQALQRQGYYVF